MKKVVCMVLAGGTAPLTGGDAIYGNAVKNAAQIAVDEINAKGGVQFELRYEDDQNDPEKAVNAYNTLKDWGMQISLGSVTSKPCEVTSGDTFAARIIALTHRVQGQPVPDVLHRPQPGQRLRAVHRRQGPRHQGRCHLEERRRLLQGHL